jgi:HSP20 family protein
VPAVESFDREGDIVLRMELPGVSKDQLEIRMEGDLLTIRGEKKDERSSEEGTTVYFRELSYGSFERSFRLPEDLKRDAVQASFRDGVLELTLPVRKPESRKITIEGDERKAA